MPCGVPLRDGGTGLTAQDESMAPGRPDLLVFVRHGQSARQVAKSRNQYFPDEDSRRPVHGIPDWEIPLTEEGHRQAIVTGQSLREQLGTFDYIYHSGYRRTEATAAAILQAYSESERAQMRVRVNPFIRERDPGYTYDMTAAEADAAFPWLSQYWTTFGPWFSRPPGGESLADVANRVYLFLNMLFRDRARQRVLVVTHGGTLRCFRFLLERWTFDQVAKELETYRTPNCCVTTYQFNPASGRLLLDRLNDVYGEWGNA
jgi:broad specificity phosphatase PhoE